jgi:hypothetical protein
VYGSAGFASFFVLHSMQASLRRHRPSRLTVGTPASYLGGGGGIVGSDISPETIRFSCFYSVLPDYVMWDHDPLIAQSFPLFIREDSYS